jgi:hypothetical protein
MDRRAEKIIGRKIVVIGSPGVAKSDFPGTAEVPIKADPREGHLAGPRNFLSRLMPNTGYHNCRVGVRTARCSAPVGPRGLMDRCPRNPQLDGRN